MDRVIRGYASGDAPALLAICQAAITMGAAQHYDGAQRAAWAARFNDPQRLANKLAGQDASVAEQDGQIAGLMTRNGDLLDLAFVAPAMMGQGLAGALYARLLNGALAQGVRQLTAEASHLARPFLERQGWQTQALQTVDLDGVALQNFRMVKSLV